MEGSSSAFSRVLGQIDLRQVIVFHHYCYICVCVSKCYICNIYIQRQGYYVRRNSCNMAVCVCVLQYLYQLKDNYGMEDYGTLLQLFGELTRTFGSRTLGARSVEAGEGEGVQKT